MREIVTRIDIAAAPERVWAVLVDFTAYREWNPYLRSVSGELAPGSRLRVEAVRAGGKASTYRPVLSAREDGRRLAWRSTILARRLLVIEHAFELEPLDDRHTRFQQRETFHGALAPLGGRALASARDSFEAMNSALKLRAEGGPGEPSAQSRET